MQNGEVYTWGRGINGCLGTGSNETQYSPILVSFNQALYPFVKTVSAGGCHTICLDQQGRVYSFGANGNQFIFYI
jgi:alpha-tubulin suppressor-like RCC1 family protein